MSTARALLGGAITHRQRPVAAGGITFLSLEDETGIANIVVSEGLWQHHRQVVRTNPALLVRGLAQIADGSSTLQADQIHPSTSASPPTPATTDKPPSDPVLRPGVLTKH